MCTKKNIKQEQIGHPYIGVPDSSKTSFSASQKRNQGAFSPLTIQIFFRSSLNRFSFSYSSIFIVEKTKKTRKLFFKYAPSPSQRANRWPCCGNRIPSFVG